MKQKEALPVCDYAVAGLQTGLLQIISLMPILDASVCTVSTPPLPDELVSLRNIVLAEQERLATDITIVMAIQHHSCPSSMVQAMQVSSLIASHGVALVGVTKNGTNPALSHFQDRYLKRLSNIFGTLIGLSTEPLANRGCQSMLTRTYQSTWKTTKRLGTLFLKWGDC